MPRCDNYPDDIRTFDHHPGSPFYDEPEDDESEERELAEESAAEDIADNIGE